MIQLMVWSQCIKIFEAAKQPANSRKLLYFETSKNNQEKISLGKSVMRRCDIDCQQVILATLTSCKKCE
jgi:hypothetical protein